VSDGPDGEQRSRPRPPSRRARTMQGCGLDHPDD
jgi:hypothetical protein